MPKQGTAKRKAVRKKNQARAVPLGPKLVERLRIELPEGFLETGTTMGGIPKARIAGAVAAAVGAYLFVRSTQKLAGDIVRAVVGGATGFFEGVFNVFTAPFIGIPVKPGSFQPGFTKEQEQLFAADPFAISVGLITGGMILAGQNPGELLKGIGEIIPG